MNDPFIGELMLFAGNFAPRGWATCDGQLLSIAQNSALFSILGTTYGGDGKTTFALPDLRGRAPLHHGTGAGLSDRRLGQRGGEERVTLTTQQIPAHSHSVKCSNKRGDSNQPSSRYPAVAGADNQYRSDTDENMNPGMVAQTGGNQPHDNMSPYLILNYCIALQGIFPSRS